MKEEASRPMKPRPETVRAAEEALRALCAADLLIAHGGGVFARPGAYLQLARAFERYAQDEINAIHAEIGD